LSADLRNRRSGVRIPTGALGESRRRCEIACNSQETSRESAEGQRREDAKLCTSADRLGRIRVASARRSAGLDGCVVALAAAELCCGVGGGGPPLRLVGAGGIADENQDGLVLAQVAPALVGELAGRSGGADRDVRPYGGNGDRPPCAWLLVRRGTHGGRVVSSDRGGVPAGFRSGTGRISGLIIRRSQVRILPGPLRERPGNTGLSCSRTSTDFADEKGRATRYATSRVLPPRPEDP
jgi:hypothetical protein